MWEISNFARASAHAHDKHFISKSWQMISWLFYLFCILIFFVVFLYSIKVFQARQIGWNDCHVIWHPLKIKQFLYKTFLFHSIAIDLMEVCSHFSGASKSIHINWTVINIKSWLFLYIQCKCLYINKFLYANLRQHNSHCKMCWKSNFFLGIFAALLVFCHPFEIVRPNANCLFVFTVFAINHMWHWTYNIVFFPFLLFAFFHILGTETTRRNFIFFSYYWSHARSIQNHSILRLNINTNRFLVPR